MYLTLFKRVFMSGNASSTPRAVCRLSEIPDPGHPAVNRPHCQNTQNSSQSHSAPHKESQDSTADIHRHLSVLHRNPSHVFQHLQQYICTVRSHLRKYNCGESRSCQKHSCQKYNKTTGGIWFRMERGEQTDRYVEKSCKAQHRKECAPLQIFPVQ